MSITSGAAALAGPEHRRPRSVGVCSRALRAVTLVIVGLVPAAYLAGSRRAKAAARTQRHRLADLERRLDAMERSLVSGAPAPPDKQRAASHYELLATQVACERRVAALEGRISAIEPAAPITTN